MHATAEPAVIAGMVVDAAILVHLVDPAPVPAAPAGMTGIAGMTGTGAPRNTTAAPRTTTAAAAAPDRLLPCLDQYLHKPSSAAWRIDFL